MLAKTIELLRTAKQMSQRQLSIKAGISHTEISRIENRERINPSVKVLNKLAKALNVDLMYLVLCCVEEQAEYPLIDEMEER
ncbi:MAG: helix-turn-helix domain-containing protein [Acetivibrionales bacterium]